MPLPTADRVGLAVGPFEEEGAVFKIEDLPYNTEGFSQTQTITIVLAEVLNAPWMTWLLVVAERAPKPDVSKHPATTLRG